MNNTHLSLDVLDDSRPPSLGEALERARRLVSDRVGVISEVVFMETTPEEPAVYWCRAARPTCAPWRGDRLSTAATRRQSIPTGATMKAVRESIEAYCSAFYNDAEFVFRTYEEIPGEALRPEDFALFSTLQYRQADFPFAPFTRQTPVRWTSGHSLIDDRTKWVPASSVYIPYDWASGERPLKTSSRRASPAVRPMPTRC